MLTLPLHIDLTGKVCVVTGAGGAICGMFARALAQCGGKVALLDLNDAAAQKIADEITVEGGTARAYKANVLDRADLEGVRTQVLAELGPCDLLINGAGGNNPRATTDNEFHHEAKEMEGCKTFFDLDKAGAAILNLSSMNAYTPLTKIPAYSGAKAAISNFTQWLATYFAGSGIRVNAIAPGFFVGNQNRGLLFDADGKPTPRTKKILAGTPMNRFGELEELLGAMLFLLSDQAAGFITGVVLPVDGGFSAYSGV